MNLYTSIARRPGGSRRRKRFTASVLTSLVGGRRAAGGRLGTLRAARVEPRASRRGPGAAAVWRPAGMRVLSVLRSARLVSMLVLALCLGGFAYVVNDARFYVLRPEVDGRRTVPLKEVYALTGAPGLHLFWVNPEAMEAALEASPSIADARVEVGWPNRVRITLVEREPVAVWQQAGAVYWVAADGRLMPTRGEAPELLRIVAVSDRPLPEDARTVDTRTVQAALALRALRPNIASLNYFQRGGLEYDDGRGWQAYFGTGEDMAEKLAVYETLVRVLLEDRRLAPAEIQYIAVTDVRHPFYRLRSD